MYAACLFRVRKQACRMVDVDKAEVYVAKMKILSYLNRSYTVDPVLSDSFLSRIIKSCRCHGAFCEIGINV
jgi:hypothetical protein